ALPLFVWGNGACRDNGLAYGAFLRQIASHGYFVISVGVPRAERPPEPAPAAAPASPAAPAPVRNTPDETQAAQLTEAIDWAERENARQGGPFAGLIDVKQVAVGGHSCGGLQAIAVSADARVKTTLVLDSGIYNTAAVGRSGLSVPKSHLDTLHAPMLYLVGGTQDIAYANTVDDVRRIGHLPVFLGSLPVGHSGTFWSQPDGGDWARVATRWLDWRLKDDADASWDFAGPACRLCMDARWTVTQKRLGMPEGPFRESLYVPVRDGTRLAMNVYRPASDGRPDTKPHPVIFAFTPYRARYRNADGELVELDQLVRFGVRDLTARGYVLAMADIRGKGASFGSRRGFQDRTEAMDGRDLVQWLSAQPWGSDKVGMVGCSYLGGTTTHVASTAPPALKAIFTGATDLDKYAFVQRGGITAQFNTRPDEPLSDDLMSLPMDADVDGALLRQAVAGHARNTPMAQLWYGMPYRDSVSSLTGNRFWEEVGPYPYLETIRKAGIATYFWGNWQDEPTEQVILWSHNLQSKLLVGPGSHCVPPPGYDLGAEIGRFFDQHLKGKDTGLYREPRVTYWLDGPQGGSWEHASREPGAEIKRTRWYLAGNHQLSTGRAARAAADRMTVDYNVGSAEYFAFWVTSQAEHGLAYTSAPVGKAMRFVGAPVLELSLAADRSDANVFAYVEDVAPDGKSEVISMGRLKASQRRLSPAPYDTLGMPWQSGLERDAQPLTPGRAATLRFALTPTARVIAAGHSLRVVVTGADPRQRNLPQIRETPPPQLQIGLGGASFVELPLADAH
ncbi:MAG TPA: CocE/NonD family hydrolase, partial [Steroidobacteraceae bacterium]|nr:CocE/NonD family hydrolase [Steroidobacteraceae bacterium]